MPLRWLSALAMLLALTLSFSWTGQANARLDGGLAGDAIYASDAVDVLDSWLTPSAAQPTNPGGTLVGLFNRPGVIGGFAAGFIGSGVIGLLFGHGIFGEMTGAASVLGLLFQLALLILLARLIWAWWHDDNVDAAAHLSPRQLADAYGHGRNEALPNIDCEERDDGLGHPK